MRPEDMAPKADEARDYDPERVREEWGDVRPFARRLFDAVDGMALDASTDPAPALGALDGLTLPQAEALAYWVETLRAVALVKSLELAAEAADRMRRAAADGK